MWRSAVCAVQGAGHRKKAVPCQDKTFEFERGGVHIVALADGAGSARLSHFGAERVVRTVSALLADRFETYQACADALSVKREIVGTLRAALEEEAADRRCAVSELASTLLAAAVSGDRFLLVHIGDGVIGYLDGDELKVASHPENGEFSNVTTFVTSESAIASMRVYKGALRDKSGFVLMSDGTEQSLYRKRTGTLADSVSRLMQRTCLLRRDAMERQLTEAFTSVITHRTADDCSIAILARPSAALLPVERMGFEERRSLYGIPAYDGRLRKRVSRYDAILGLLNEPRCVRQVAACIHLRPAGARARLEELRERGLVERTGNRYRKA